jgi:HAD superfamily hydrolase (TIGR01490 family)
VRNKEVKAIEEVPERSRGLAAFFDLDGTLVAGPSLERNFFNELRRRGKIPWKNYLLWLAEAVRLAPQGIEEVLHGNKMYLKGAAADLAETLAAKRAPRFYGEGIERVGWHVRQGHAIYLVSGTLEGLAASVALALVARLAARGVATKIGYRATRLEEVHGRWNGKIAGEATYGEAKARALRKIAKQEEISLEKSYAYGNSWDDRWILTAVGQATAVNPSAELEGLAVKNGWAVMRWTGEEKGQAILAERRKERSEENHLLFDITKY